MGACCNKQSALHRNVSLRAKECSHGSERPRSGPVDLPPALLGVETPQVPGDVSLAGTLSNCTIVELAKRYKAWLYLNPKGLSSHFVSGPRISNRAVGFPTEAIERAGCRLLILDFFRPPVPPEQTSRMLEAMSQLPRPLMVQCTTGTRSSALLILWLAKHAGHNLESALRVAEDMKCLRRLMDSGWVREWLLPELNSTLELSEPSGYLLEQFFEPVTFTNSYLVVCKATKEGVLIDPCLNRTDAYLMLLDEAGIHLKYVLNTHCHYEHMSITGSDAIRKLRGDVKLLSSKESGAAADEFLVHGQLVHFGHYHLEVRATPGHTSGCLTYVLHGLDHPKVAFTGDALLVRGCGRTDFAQGDAGRLYDSVHAQIFTLDPDTHIYPCHEYNGRNNSTVGEEKAYNPRLTHCRDDFILLMDELELPKPKFQVCDVPRPEKQLLSL
ncbi:Persulfide dioxygenase ETHE1 homolog [Durusdinium trenchii]|uniref:Mitochondrial (Glyoxalase II) (Glx II) (Sulfur dioxygenase ETHE1) n=1 Tax=Durusdinium trenchii TaxID=1381693 RepID=A0ABP0L4L2_9DINO